MTRTLSSQPKTIVNRDYSRGVVLEYTLTRVAYAERHPSPSIDNAGGFFPYLYLSYASSPDIDPPDHGLRPCAVQLFLSSCLLPSVIFRGTSSPNTGFAGAYRGAYGSVPRRFVFRLVNHSASCFDYASCFG